MLRENDRRGATGVGEPAVSPDGPPVGFRKFYDTATTRDLWRLVVPIGLLIAVFVKVPRPSEAAMHLPPSEAMKVLPETVDRVRRAMNSDPEIVRYAFSDVGAALPGNRDILRLAAEVVAKSTNSQSALYAMAAVNDFASSSDRGYREASAEIFRKAIGSRNAEMRRFGAYYLGQLGSLYRDESYRAFKHQISQSPHPLPIYQLMVQTFGGSRDVIFFFVDRLTHTQDSSVAEGALSQLAIIASRHAPLDPSAAGMTFAAFDSSLAHQSSAIQLSAAFHLQMLGGEHSRKARAFLERRLREPLGESEDMSRSRWIAVYRILRPLLSSRKREDKMLLIDAAKANDLISFYESDISSRQNDGLNQQYLRAWKDLVKSDSE